MPGFCQLDISEQILVYIVYLVYRVYLVYILEMIQTFSFKKMRLKTSSLKWRPFCAGEDELTAHELSIDHMVSFNSIYYLKFRPVFVECNHKSWTKFSQ